MRIGNGTLEIGMIRADDNISPEQLEKLARDTLSIEPFGEIFFVSDLSQRLSSAAKASLSIGLDHEFLKDYAHDIAYAKGWHLSAVVFVSEERHGITNRRYRYVACSAQSFVLAYELGHFQGLCHPTDHCSGCSERGREYACQYATDLMCRNGNPAFEQQRTAFSPAKIKLLRSST